MDQRGQLINRQGDSVRISSADDVKRSCGHAVDFRGIFLLLSVTTWYFMYGIPYIPCSQVVLFFSYFLGNIAGISND